MRSPASFSRQSFLLVLVLVIISSLHAQNWPQWRGPARDGRVTNFAAPATWPDSLQRVWRIAAGAGLSSPVVADEKIFLLTREGEEEIVSCYESANGKRLWQQRYHAPFIPNVQATSTRLFPASRGRGPFATPVIHRGYLYTLGVDRVLSCFEAKTGGLLWRKHFLKQQTPDTLVYECPKCGCNEDGKEFAQGGECSACRMPLSPKGLETSATFGRGNYYGASASPLIAGKLGIVNIGNLEGGEVIALELKTGAEKWRWRGSPPSSSSPILAEWFGAQQVLVLTREHLVGLEMKSGAQLWSFAIESNAQIVTPIVFEDLVIFSAYRSPTTAVRIKKEKEAWSAKKAWSTNEVTLYTSTPVLAGDQLYGLSYANRGQFFAMEAATGKVRWTSEGRQAEGAAILSAGEIILALTEGAKLITMAAGDTAYHAIKTYHLADSPTWAHPVLWDKNILVKDETQLTLWRVE
jgi:outer membrane protein assembly factor BamB